MYRLNFHFFNTVQRLKNEIQEQRYKGLEEQNLLQEQAFKDMQRTHNEHANQIIHQMKREQERISRDNERVLEAKLKVKQGTYSKKVTFNAVLKGVHKVCNTNRVCTCLACLN